MHLRADSQNASDINDSESRLLLHMPGSFELVWWIFTMYDTSVTKVPDPFPFPVPMKSVLARVMVMKCVLNHSLFLYHLEAKDSLQPKSLSSRIHSSSCVPSLSCVPGMALSTEILELAGRQWLRKTGALVHVCMYNCQRKPSELKSPSVPAQDRILL